MRIRKIPVIVERASDGFFSVYCKDEMFSGMGESAEAAIEDMVAQMKAYRKLAIKEKIKYPSFLDGQLEFDCQTDVLSAVKYYVNSGYLSLSNLEKITGINQKQLWAYMNGTKPRKTQTDRIEEGLHKLTKDLSTMFA